MAVKLTLRSAAFHVRNVRARLPFRHGTVTLTHFPLLHMAVGVDTDGPGGRAFATDYLPLTWFDKDDSLETAT
jgi:hypothetical protein